MVAVALLTLTTSLYTQNRGEKPKPVRSTKVLKNITKNSKFVVALCAPFSAETEDLYAKIIKRDRYRDAGLIFVLVDTSAIDQSELVQLYGDEAKAPLFLIAFDEGSIVKTPCAVDQNQDSIMGGIEQLVGNKIDDILTERDEERYQDDESDESRTPYVYYSYDVSPYWYGPYWWGPTWWGWPYWYGWWGGNRGYWHGGWYNGRHSGRRGRGGRAIRGTRRSGGTRSRRSSGRGRGTSARAGRGTRTGGTRTTGKTRSTGARRSSGVRPGGRGAGIRTGGGMRGGGRGGMRGGFHGGGHGGGHR